MNVIKIDDDFHYLIYLLYNNKWVFFSFVIFRPSILESLSHADNAAD